MNVKQTHLNIGEQYQIEITDLSHAGEGVGRVAGMAVFVPEAIPGDLVRAEVISTKKTYARALIVEIIEQSADRITPTCPVAEFCGGCQLAHLQYEQQLRWKQRIVEDALERIGKLEVDVLPIIGMDKPEGYRNKTQLPVGLVNQELVMGMYQKRSHDIVDFEACQNLHPLMNKALRVTKQVLKDLKIAPYNELNHTGVIRHLVIRTSFSEQTLMLVFVTRTDDLPKQKQLIERLREELPELASIAHNVNSKRTNVIFGDKTEIIWGESHIVDEIGELKFAISPRSFYQVNPVQTQILYDLVKDAASLTKGETVWDLYCGVGTIGLYLASDAARLIGVESVREAVVDAELNAKMNGITHAEFYHGKAETIAPQLVKQGKQPDVVVVDPPRKGCDRSLLETLKEIKAARIVYVSCNPATLARDLGYLTEHGYRVEMVQPVDMFPMTSHVECVVLMSRVEK